MIKDGEGKDDENKEKGKDAKTKFKEAFDNIHMPKMPKFSFLKKKTDTEEEKEEASDAVAVVTKDKDDVIVEVANNQDANAIDTKTTIEEEAIVEGKTEAVALDAKSMDTKSIAEEEAIQVSGAKELKG